MANKFGDRSNSELNTTHGDLVKIMNLSLRRSYVDFGVHQGERTIDEQQDYFNEGRSSINPSSYNSMSDLAKVAKHIVIPGSEEYGKSRAVDIHVSESYDGKNLTWDMLHLAYIAGVVTSVAKELYDSGAINHVIRWGGDWNSNGIIGLDQKLDDLVHYELIKI